MRSLQYKILLGGLAVLLSVTACSTVSPAMPTVATFPPASAAAAVTDTASPIPATAAPTVPVTTDTATPIPATATPTLPALPVASSPSIQSLTMLDLNNGWAVTDTGLVRTADGGSPTPPWWPT